MIKSRIDTGLIQYLEENSKKYVAKYQEDGSMLICERGETEGTYYDGTSLSNFEYYTSCYDTMVKIPSVYFRCIEIEEDIFSIKFSTYPFIGSNHVFGENVLVGYHSGGVNINPITGLPSLYANVSHASDRNTINYVNEALISRGKGYRAIYSEEIGVLTFLQILKMKTVSQNVIGNPVTGNDFIVGSLLNNGNSGVENATYIQNIKIDNLIANVEHLDGTTELLPIPSVWGGYLNMKLHIGKYLSFIPKTTQGGIFNGDMWSNNLSTNFTIDSGNGNKWLFGLDKTSDNNSKNYRLRICFEGIINETRDVESFDALPIIN